MQMLPITSTFIQLNQALKLAGWVENGAEANDMIDQGYIMVNGVQEFRKRNKLYPGAIVEFDGQTMKIVSEIDD